MPEKPKKRPGPVSLFRGKRRAPVSLTLTEEHHKKVEHLLITQDASKAFAILEACYRPAPGAMASDGDDAREIDPEGLAALFKKLADS